MDPEVLHTPLLIIHLIGTTIGVGAATVSDVLFFSFLKDYRISRFEAATLHLLHPLLWTALVILVISGTGLVLLEPTRLLASPKFQLKMVVVTIIALNGLFLHFRISPKLRRINFRPPHLEHRRGELVHLRAWAFASGAVSCCSWYAALILGALRTIPFTLGQGLLAYVGLLAISIAVAQGIARQFDRSARV